MLIAYFFLLLEGFLRILILAVANNDIVLYGSMMFNFMIANVIGSAIALGLPIMCNIDERNQSYREKILLYLVITSLLCSLLLMIFQLNFTTLFIGILYPSLGVLCSRNVNSSFSIILRVIKISFWINLFCLLKLVNYSEFLILIVVITLLILILNKVKLNMDFILKSVSLNSLKFAFSSLLGILPKSSEQIFVKIFFSDVTLGEYIKLRELVNMINYSMGPFLSERLYSKKISKKIYINLNVVFLASVLFLYVYASYLNINPYIILLIQLAGIVEFLKLFFYIKLEIRSSFFATWVSKLSVIPAIVASIPFIINYPEFITSASELLCFFIIVSFIQLMYVWQLASSNR